ncbi:hypothetical protein QJS77_14800, partial [Enterococcus faecium]|uniref:hypothetical protein n=1 Tax=Enterococcus faecium TaxID=1352 RepID=UPI00396E08F3
MRAWIGTLFFAGLLAASLSLATALKEEIDLADEILSWGRELVSAQPLSSKHAITLAYNGGKQQIYLTGRRNDVSPKALPEHIQ